ncbi:Yqey-like protein-domain-containing protein [Dunaliella salina]|uniref:Yqey-like protein-domain-containing protein n=1 Tax=Dunaliella salina TaxID=3046 RepID=A0ABQ7GNU5_DUNSA|nr:Yqey-like protein-domain-containing protein [Dunaliella salina]|eukprot:KAF5836268.1 Yqey-like protein-domain-containing protein [Dunaliella salina]
MLASRKLSCFRGPQPKVPTLCLLQTAPKRNPKVSHASRRRIAVASGAGAPGGSIMDRLKEDMKTAMKAKDQPRLEAIRFLSAALKSKEIEMRSEASDAKLSDEDAIKVLMKSAKQRKDSIDSYKAGGRQDLVDKEAAEARTKGLADNKLVSSLVQAKLRGQ